jgi:hypothetical protein
MQRARPLSPFRQGQGTRPRPASSGRHSATGDDARRLVDGVAAEAEIDVVRAVGRIGGVGLRGGQKSPVARVVTR